MSNDAVCGLRELTKLTALSHEIDLILIPGIGTANADEWGLCSDPWQEQLRLLKTGARYWVFEHGVLLDQRFEWQRLIDAGNQLQSDLVALCDKHEADRRPLVFACHSFGGMILKQALNRLNVHATQNSHRYHRYFNRIAGIAFISTPHGSYNSEALSESCMFIIKQYAAGKISNQAKTVLRDSIPSLKGPQMLARRFDDIHIGVEILSIYENLPTRRKTDFIWQRQKQKYHTIVVDEDLARIQAPKEEIIGISADHSTICNLAEADGPLHLQAWKWFQDAIENAQSRVADNFRSYDVRNPATPTLSIDTASIKEASSDIEIQNDSNRAQKGSPTFDGGLNTIFENFVPVANHLNLPCYMIDTFAQNEDFFGRKDILDLMDHALLPSKSMIASSEPGTINSLVLFGPGGFGKTEIAVQFVSLRKDQFDAVFWIRAEDESKLDIDFRQIAVQLGLQKPGQAQDPVVTRNLVTEWLSNPRKVLNADDDDGHVASRAQWLLVFDNADNSDLLQEYIKIYGRGAILITSRDPRARGLFWQSESSKVAEVNKFGSQEGLEFLSHLARKRPESSDTLFAAGRKIVEHHDGHPLALAQIAGFIRHEYLSYTDILEYINDPTERMRLLDHDYGIRDTARGTVHALVAIGITKLPNESRNLLHILCFLDPDRIQENILNRSGLSQYHRARGPLLQSSLVRRNEDKNELWIHRVDQAAVKHSLELKKQVETLSKAIKLVKDAWPTVEMRRRHNVERWPRCEALYPHVVVLQTNYTEYKGSWPVQDQLNMTKLLQEAAWQVLTCMTEIEAVWADIIIRWQYERGNFNTAKPMADLAKSLCENFASDLEQKHLLSVIHDLLGCIANGTNSPKASLNNNIKFLSLRKQIVDETGERDELLAYSHNQMGCSYMMAKDYDKGAELFTEALNIWHNLETYKPGDASMEYANLGLAFLFQGQTDRAAEVLEKGHQERIAGYGMDDTESFRPGRILYALGNVRTAQGRFEDSEKLHQKALITFQMTIGNKYHRTADVSHKLAQHCMRRAVSGDTNSLDIALKLVDQALSIWAANEAAYKPELTRTTYLKSKILTAKHSAEEAKALLEKAISGYQSLTPRWEEEGDDLTEAHFDELVTFWSR